MKILSRRLLPLILIAGLAMAFSLSGGNCLSCDGLCSVPPMTR